MDDLGVYVHIPFCKAKCSYCDFVSFAGKESLIENYINALCMEIANFDFSKYNVKTVYIGGGTPSILESTLILKVLEKIDLSKVEEVTIEVNPGTVTKEKLEDYVSFGINRLSIGLQSTNDKLLKEIRKNT